MTKNVSIDEMSVEQLQKVSERVLELVHEIESLLPGMTLMTSDDRLHTDGRIRGDEEQGALLATLAVVDHEPAAFRVLADKDNGRDPKRVETDLLRSRLARRAVLAKLSGHLSPLAQMLEDTVLAQGELCKPVISSAYKIAKPLADNDAEIRTKLQPALNYYGAIARKGAKTRADAAAAAKETK